MAALHTPKNPSAGTTRRLAATRGTTGTPRATGNRPPTRIPARIKARPAEQIETRVTSPAPVAIPEPVAIPTRSEPVVISRRPWYRTPAFWFDWAPMVLVAMIALAAALTRIVWAVS